MCGVMYLGFTLLGMGPKDLTLVWFHIIPKKKKKILIKCLRVIVQRELAPFEKSKIEGDVIGLKPMKQIYNLVIRKGLTYTYKLANMIFHNKVIDEIPTSIEILCNDTPSPKLVSFHQAAVLDCIWLTIPPISRFSQF